MQKNRRVSLWFSSNSLGSTSAPRWSSLKLHCTSVSKMAMFLSPDLTSARRFSSHAQNYTTLLLEDEKGILYVGARGAVFSLNSSNIADGSHRTVSVTFSHQQSHRAVPFTNWVSRYSKGSIRVNFKVEQLTSCSASHSSNSTVEPPYQMQVETDRPTDLQTHTHSRLSISVSFKEPNSFALILIQNFIFLNLVLRVG